MASVAFWAVQHAMIAARKDAGIKGVLLMDVPATVDAVQQNCGVDQALLSASAHRQ